MQSARMGDTARDARAYRVILFDLFGTLVFFKQVPLVKVGSSGTTHARMAAAVERELPGLALAEFLAHVREVTREIVEARRETHAECSSQERFRRVLARLGETDEGIALRLCTEHMAGLADATEMPPHHVELLRSLAEGHRVGLVSNFDHGATAREILRRHGLADLLHPIVISDEIGWRKPKVDVFHAALGALEEPPEAALFVGDTPLDDIDGARRAGLDAAWINASDGVYPRELHAPTVTLAKLADLSHFVRQR